jgi:cytochrome d ubiquinol oxidase subunit II
MQNPVGAKFDYHTMRMEVSSFAEVMFNPVAQAKFVHTISAGYVTGTILSAIVIGRYRVLAFIASGLSIAGIIASVGVSMFPFILPSSSNPNHSLLVWDSSSSEVTLNIMLFATLIFFPIILAYTAWVYRVLRGEVNIKTIINNEESAY